MIQEIMKEGKLVPQEITIALLRDAMREHNDVPGFLIDGFPREISQGEQFEQEVSTMFVFFFCVLDQVGFYLEGHDLLTDANTHSLDGHTVFSRTHFLTATDTHSLDGHIRTHLTDTFTHSLDGHIHSLT
jgi:hypothetical protein